jgi:uncharacterized membrane protein
MTDDPPVDGRRRFRWSNHQLLAAIFVLALLLRVYDLGGKSLWLDEAYTLHYGQPTLTPVDPNNPPLFYTFLHHWTGRFGRSEAAARLPSALLSFLNVGLLYVLARRLAGDRVALMAAALLAVSPLNIWYAQEARMYAALVTVALLMALGLALRRWTGYLLFFAALVLGLYLGYLTFPLWAGISAVWVVAWWRAGRRPGHLLAWMVASAAAWLAYRPMWPYFHSWLETALVGHWMFQRVRDLFALPPFCLSHFLLLLAAAVGGLIAAGFLVSSLLRRERLHGPFTAAAGLLFLLVLGLAVAPRLYGLKRVLVTGWPFVILFVAWLSENAGRHRVRLQRGLWGASLLTALIVLLGVPKDDWRGAAAYIQSQAPGARPAVWVDPSWNNVPHDYYRPDNPARYGDLAALQALAAGEPAIWLIAERFPGNAVPGSRSEAWLDEIWELVEAVPFHRLEVRHYRAPQIGSSVE